MILNVSVKYLCLQKGPAKGKKAKEVEKVKPEDKAPEAPAENGEAKAEEEVCCNVQLIESLWRIFF